VGITELIAQHITAWINAGGYPSVAFLMMLESMIAPVPSEAVMPFAGCLIATHRFTFLGVAIASTIGSIVGSTLSYAAGYYGGRPLVTRFGKYLLLNQHDLDLTERFFGRYGSIAILIGRFVPVIRHLISIPAGAGRMRFVPFLVYTTIGACIWNTFLAWVGFHLGNHWELVHQYSRPIDIVMGVLLLAAIAYFIRTHVRRAARRSA
jgi:membrane protein DedA with SNARE-associated domain